jgi:hypothetical protein
MLKIRRIVAPRGGILVPFRWFLNIQTGRDPAQKSGKKECPHEDTFQDTENKRKKCNTNPPNH